MPVQRVCRPNHTFRGFQGQIESGQISVGDEIVTLPSKEHAKVKSLLIGDKDAQTAEKGRPVTIQLDREVDVSRGCVLANKTELPVSKSFTATVLWMDDGELLPGKEYFVKIGTKEIPGIVTNIQYKIDVNTGEYIPANNLRKNEIAVCDVILQEEIVLDEFDDHKVLGELILIDRITNMTSACGVIKNSEVDEETDLKCVFAHGKLKANGDIFEEFYYNMDKSYEPEYADDIKTAVDNFEERLSQKADTNHLKVILIGKTLRNDKAAYSDFMEYCKTSKKFPRNTYVCIADDINDIFDNMGDYYEQKMNKENHEDGKPIITLGTLLDDYTNEIHETR